MGSVTDAAVKTLFIDGDMKTILLCLFKAH